MKRFLIPIVALFAMGLVHAKDDQPLPKDLPPYAAERALPVPQIAQRTLRNGLTVWVVPRAGLPKLNAVLAVRGGLASDTAELRGTARVLAGLVTGGTRARNSRELAEALQAIGGTINAFAGSDGVTVSGNANLSQRARLIELMADVAINANFPEAEVALAKTNELEALKGNEASPGFLAARALRATIYGSHPYGRINATQTSLNALSRTDLVAAYDARFRPERALLVVSGRVESGEVFKQVERYFGGWRGRGVAAPAVATVEAQAKPKRVIVDRPGSVQASLRVGRVGIAANHEDAIALALTDTLLGGGLTSRIARNIREDKGYTYSPGSSATRALLGGAISAQAEVRNDVTAATLNEILYEFDRLGTTPIGEDELTRGKRYFAGLYLFANQLQGAVAATLANNWLSGLPPEYLGTYVDKARSVTAEQVREIARRYYPSRLQSLVIVGDRKAIEAELAQYGEFEEFQAP
jgi:predicted Zn-dependent peptidase